MYIRTSRRRFTSLDPSSPCSSLPNNHIRLLFIRTLDIRYSALGVYMVMCLRVSRYLFIIYINTRTRAFGGRYRGASVYKFFQFKNPGDMPTYLHGVEICRKQAAVSPLLVSYPPATIVACFHYIPTSCNQTTATCPLPLGRPLYILLHFIC